MEAIAVAVLLALQSGASSDAAEMKALRENNIFSPKKAKREETRRDERGGRGSRGETSSSSSAPQRPKPPVVTGIIRDAASGTYQAVVEDKNPVPSSSSSGPDLRQFKEPKFLKAGDALLTYTIESVEIDKVGVKCGETSKTLKVGESFPDNGATAAPESSSTSTAAPAPAKPPPTTAESAEMDDIKKKMKERTKKNRSYDTPE